LLRPFAAERAKNQIVGTPVKVALVYESFGFSESLERQRVLLSRALIGAGAEVHFYGNVDHRTAKIAGVTTHSLFPQVRPTPAVALAWTYGRLAAAATKTLRRERDLYDIIDVAGTTAWEHDVLRAHAVTVAEQRRWPLRGGRSYAAAGLRARIAPVRFPKLAVARSIERLQYRPDRFALALAVTDEVRRDLMEVHGVPEERIEVEPNPVDIDSFRMAPRGWLRSAIGIDSDVPLVLFVGHGFQRKGLADAITALAGLDDSAHLAVVGGGDADPYSKRALELGVRDRVHFIGATETPEASFRDADLFVLPTHEDVWGNTVVEAMSAGTPVVTTDAAGASSLVKESGAGLVVAAGSVRSLREAIARVIGDPALSRQMANRGEAAAARYGLEAFGLRMLLHYERALRTPARRN
jgi:glycosyltransferase involved in cell wall biosynthesis